jgi:hypothetical protein
MPDAFVAQDPWSIKNGTAAKSEIFQTQAKNQTWLACGGAMPLINFFVMQQNATTPTTDDFRRGAWTNVSRVVPVLVPPFATHADFCFFAAKDFRPSTETLAYIKATGNAARQVTNIPVGEDLTGSGKSALGDRLTGKWVWMQGITETMRVDDPGAVPLVAAASNTWQRVNVTIEVSQYAYVQAAAYRVVPPRDSYVITYTP